MLSKAGTKYKKASTLGEYLATRYVVSTTGCWEWANRKDRDGYGRITHKWYKVHGKSGAHQLSYIAHTGVIPTGMLVCHTCDNPSCINPTHLFLGTPQDNMDDKKKKGRQHVMSQKQKDAQSADLKACGGMWKKYGLDISGVNNPNYGKTRPGLNSGSDNAMYGLKGKDNPNFGSTRSEKQKENISMGIIKDNIAIYEQILTRLQTKVTLSKLATEFGVSIATVSRLKNGTHAIFKFKGNTNAK
jgi:hypothetical protein